jgi:hypothetical protein
MGAAAKAIVDYRRGVDRERRDSTLDGKFYSFIGVNRMYT